MTERRGRGEGSLYQRASDGRWVGVVDLGWVGGKRVRKTVTATTKREVMAKLKSLRSQVESGALPDAMTVEQWLDHWLNTIAAKKVRTSTLNTYRGYVRTWVVPHVGKRRLDRLRPDHIRALYQAMEDAGKSDATRRQVHAILRRSLVVAKREQRIVVNPAEQVDPPAVGKGSHGHLTLPEAKRVLAQLDDPQWSTSRWACALLAGLRQGEALGLRWDDVDLDSGVIRVRQAAQRVKGQGVQIVELKSKTALRDVPMVGPVWESLAAEPGPHQGYVWPNPFQPDQPESSRRDWQRWRDLLAAADVAPRPLHAARATCASLLSEAGASDTQVKEILGHSQIVVTQRHYLHSNPLSHRRAMDDLGRLLR